MYRYTYWTLGISEDELGTVEWHVQSVRILAQPVLLHQLRVLEHFQDIVLVKNRHTEYSPGDYSI